MFSAFPGQIKGTVLYMMVNLAVSQECVIFQCQSHSALKPERLVNYKDVFLKCCIYDACYL